MRMRRGTKLNFDPFGGKTVQSKLQAAVLSVCFFCGICGKIELGHKPSRMSSRLFIAKSPSLSGLEAFVADLVLPAGKSGSLGSPLQVLKAKSR